MTYVTVITMVAYVVLVVLLGAISLIDARTRRIPNGLVAAMAALWAAWRLALGFAGAHTGVGFTAGLVSSAPEVPLPFGLAIVGESLAGGLIGALVLGGGLLVLTAAYEVIAHKEAFGGGDIKLLAVLGLFLGWERGVLCILAACVASVLYVLVKTLAGKRPAEKARDAFGSTTMPFGPFIALGTLAAFVS